MSPYNRLILSRALLAFLFCGMGTLHFIFPAAFARVIPPFLPFPSALVAVSGVCEILGGLGVLLPAARRAAGIGLIALLVAVFPANVYMLMLQYQAHGWTPAAFLLTARLPLQYLLIVWVIRATRRQDFPLSVTNQQAERKPNS